MFFYKKINKHNYLYLKKKKLVNQESPLLLSLSPSMCWFFSTANKRFFSFSSHILHIHRVQGFGALMVLLLFGRFCLGLKYPFHSTMQAWRKKKRQCRWVLSSSSLFLCLILVRAIRVMGCIIHQPRLDHTIPNRYAQQRRHLQPLELGFSIRWVVGSTWRFFLSISRACIFDWRSLMYEMALQRREALSIFETLGMTTDIDH